MMYLNIDAYAIMQLIPLLGCLQGYIFCFILMANRKLDKHKSIFLAAHIFSASSLLLLPFIEQYFGWNYSWTADSLIWISVPSTYFYLHMFSRPTSFNKDMLHLVVLTLGAYTLEYWFFIYKANIAVVEGRAELLHSPLHLYISIGKFIVFFGYFFAAASLYRKHQQFIRENFSNIRHYNLKWVRNILIWNALLIGYALLAFILSYYIKGFTIGKSNMTAYWVLIIYIYYASIKGFMQKDIHIEPVNITETQLPLITEAPAAEAVIQNVEADIPDEKKVKYQKSRLSEGEAKKIVDKVIKAIEKDKLYLDPELTLQELSARADVQPYMVSQSLSMVSGKNFYELINSYRVETAKRLLTSPEKRHLTILSIGFEAGFNSKTTFNTVFKKSTGQTPSEYQKMQVKNI